MIIFMLLFIESPRDQFKPLGTAASRLMQTSLFSFCDQRDMRHAHAQFDDCASVSFFSLFRSFLHCQVGRTRISLFVTGIFLICLCLYQSDRYQHGQRKISHQEDKPINV